MISDSPTFKQGHGSPEWKAGVGWGGRGLGAGGWGGCGDGWGGRARGGEGNGHPNLRLHSNGRQPLGWTWDWGAWGSGAGDWWEDVCGRYFSFVFFSFLFFSFTGMNDITFEAYNPLLLLCVMCLSYRCSPPTYVSRVAYGRLSYLNP